MLLRVFAALLLLAVKLAAQNGGVTDVLQALQSGQPARALELLKPLLSASPADARLLTLNGMALASTGQPKAALASYRRALRQNPKFLAALQGAAQTEYELQDPKAAATLRAVLEASPDNQTAHAMLAVIEFEKKNFASAAADFGKAGAAVDQNPSALWQYGQSLYLLKRSAEAAPVFERLARLKPEDPGVRYNLALCLLDSGDAKGALAALGANAKPDVDALRLASSAHEALGETAEALAKLRQAAQLDPRDDSLYLQFASLCLDHHSYELGLELLDVGLKNAGPSSRLLAMRGVFHAQLGKGEEAERDFQRAVDLDPNQRYGQLGLSLTLLEAGKLDESIGILRRQTAAHPNDGESMYLLAEALIRKGAEPGTKEFDESVRLLQGAVKSSPRLVQARVTLGKLLLKQNQISEAVALLQEAVRQDPANRTAVYQLSTALRRAGRADDAVAQLDKLKSLMKDERVREVETNRIRLVKAAPERSAPRP